MVRVGVVIACATALAGPAGAASPDPRALAVDPAAVARARDLVGKLGSPEFSEREEAQAGLVRMGRLALPALTEAVRTHPSAEVRSRSGAILPRASAAEFQARLDTFLADTGGKFEHGLPGWAEFQKLAGPTPAAREVFVGLLADPVDREMVFASARPGGEFAQSVAARKQELYLWRYPRSGLSDRREPTVANVIALLYAETRVKVSVTVARRLASASSLVGAAGVFEAVHDPSDKGRAYKAVVVGWVESREDPTSMTQAISVATALELREAAGVAARLAVSPAAPTYTRGQAVMAVARLGAKAYLPVLESLFADDAVAIGGRRGFDGGPSDTQMRDVALAAALLVTGQDPEDFGFSQRYSSSGAARFSYSNWSIPAGRRAAALAWWKVWRENNPGVENEK